VARGARAMESSLAGNERNTGGATPRSDTQCRKSSSTSRDRRIPLRASVADDEGIVAKWLGGHITGPGKAHEHNGCPKIGKRILIGD
jgi:hypothetical protein